MSLYIKVIDNRKNHLLMPKNNIPIVNILLKIN